MIDRMLLGLKKYGLLINSRNLENLSEWKGSIKTDNRLIETGDIFVCIKGEKFDGHKVVNDALAKGAEIIVAQEPIKGEFPCIQVSDSRKAAAIIAKICLLPPTIPFKLIGVTGTNGKTTTSMILYQALRSMGNRCGWIGTLGYYIEGVHYQTQHTTPDIVELNTIFSKMVAEGVSYVVMEVSSHALSLDRVFGVDFDYSLFTNLSREHLDFHGTMENYAEAKYTLFERAAANDAVSVINCADDFGAEICKRLRGIQAKLFCVGGGDGFNYQNVNTEFSYTCFDLVKADVCIHIKSKLIGDFNVLNLGLTATTMYAMGFSTETIEQSLAEVEPVQGRIQRIDNDHGIGVFVDYAHTPDAVENLLKAVNSLPHKRIICLFGAGGDRDKGKRPLMLKAALKYSDAVIISDDNPRTENPNTIIKDIVQDSDSRLPWWIIRDRRTAIKACIDLAQPGDLVLICGKGHENYQEIDGVKHHFDDVEEAKAALATWQTVMSKADDELVLPVDLTLLHILLLPEATTLADLDKTPQHFRFISTDSRNIKPQSLFFAIRGEHYDGHNYIAKVLENRANHAISEHPCFTYSNPGNCIHVEDSQVFLGQLCRKYLQMFNPKRIALTGSTGKTTTKELIARILEDDRPTLKTMLNENNLIGVCKTILRLLPSHQYAVFELGTNHFGEIGKLAEIVCPEIGIILNIGPSHLEFLGDEEGVLKEKSALFNRPLAARIYPGDDPRFGVNIPDSISVGYLDSCQYQISNQVCTDTEQSFDCAGISWRIPYGPSHYGINSAFAIALAIKLGIPQNRIQESLSVPVNLNMRAQLVSRGIGFMIIDCYNANPVSMQKALEYWQQLHPELPHYAILGDMLELGDSSEMFHQMIGAMLGEMSFEMLYTIGNMAINYSLSEDTGNKTKHFDTSVALIEARLLSAIPYNAIVLIKGSHGVHLEKVIPSLEEGI